MWNKNSIQLWERYALNGTFTKLCADENKDVPLIGKKLPTDPEIDYLEICLRKYSCSGGNQFYSAYGLLKYILHENKTESFALIRKEVTEVADQEFDLVMGTLRFDWDVYKALY